MDEIRVKTGVYYAKGSDSQGIANGTSIITTLEYLLGVLLIFAGFYYLFPLILPFGLTNQSYTISPKQDSYQGRLAIIAVKEGEADFLAEDLANVFSEDEVFDRNLYEHAKKLFQGNRRQKGLDMHADKQCDLSLDAERFDCYPGQGASQANCEARGCCWREPNQLSSNTTHSRLGRTVDVPYCYYPQNYPSYSISETKETQTGFRIGLKRTVKTHWPSDIMNLTCDIVMETQNRLHIKMYDPSSQRYEVPLKTPNPTFEPNTDYRVEMSSTPFAITIYRKSTNEIVFDTNITTSPLIFADQFIQISTKVPSGVLYGLGEHRDTFKHDMSKWSQYSFWARDKPPEVGKNLYGSHPMYMSIDKRGDAYGVFLLNSNALDVDVQPNQALTFRTIGGILDFYIFTGPSPDQVISQYTDVIGHSYLPPYWGLGFHLCRWGYNDTKGLKTVVDRMRKAKMPYDTQWNDIDYMKDHLDWTLDTTKFGALSTIVKDLHEHNQHYVFIVDPGISNMIPNSYKAYDDGIKMNVFVKDSQGKPIVGKVWPGNTVFPDFTHPNASKWWFNLADEFHNHIPFDGLWTDMNEPSNFVDGSLSGCTNNNLDNPPYTPGIYEENLFAKTLCPSAKQYHDYHYNLHNMYGHFEVKVTKGVLEKVRQKRSFIISRSTFPSTGRYGGHWTGDNIASWTDLYYATTDIMTFQMFGIPLVGADICGFRGDTTEELCIRWMQAGAFYPFMRNHNDFGRKDQDPASFSQSAQDAIRLSLQLRYSLLPYLYTLFYYSHLHGTPVLRPLVFQYPRDPMTHALDKQWLWGNALMITPVLTEGARNVSAYFPEDVWYDYQVGNLITNTSKNITLSAPLDSINVHIRGGSILLTHAPDVTTVQMRKQPFGIAVAPDMYGNATGELFWDDGDSLETVEEGQYSLIQFHLKNQSVQSVISQDKYKPDGGILLNHFRILGILAKPQQVLINNKDTPFDYDKVNKVMSGFVHEPLDLLQPLDIIWK